MFFIRQQLSRILSIFITCTLAACGGGGDSDSKAIITPIDDYSINIQFVGDGEGKVDIVELNQSCSQDCTINAKAHSTVTLIATPNTDDFQFNGWQGCQQQECKLTLNSNKNVKAEFTPKEATQLLVLALGNGSVSIPQLAETCDIECEYDLAPDTVVTVIAQPDEGAEFSGWSEGCTTTELTCNVTVNGYTIVRADFETLSQNEVDVRLNVSGNGSVYIEQLDETCTNYCQYSVEKNTQLTFESTGDNGFDFLSWENCPASAATCTINISDVLTISAFFEEEPIEPTTNTIIIKEPINKQRTNLPIQIARPFIKGEIADSPTIRINGQNVSAQATVKQRYDDGSVKHAILSFVIGSLEENTDVTANIVNDSPESFTPFSKSQLLADGVGFDARFTYNFDGVEHTISARSLLTNNHYTLWQDGPVATTLLLADHSTQRNYDIGSDEYKSIRPLFYVTYWKSLGEYSVRFVSENINTTTLQDQLYDVTLHLGTEQALVYQKDDINHQARTRWTKSFSTYDDSPISIDHNLAYLVQTPSVPHFDTSKEIPANKITAYWNEWQSRDTDIYQKGFWQPAMATAGGRPDIGLYPSWTVKWLYTGDWRLADIAFTQADLSGNWPMHYREGDDERTFDFEKEVSGLGRIVSMAPGARPTHWTYRPTWHEIDDDDKIPYVGEVDSTPWRPDTAHHPDISSLQYLLTGDYYYLEQMLFSAAFVSGDSNAKAYKRSYGRGPTGSEGAMYSGEVRAQAWHLRTRVHTYDIIPDGFHEKAYFGQLISNGIALWEGKYRVGNSQPALQDLYDFSFDNISTSFVGNGEPSELGYWGSGITSASYVSDKFVKTENVSRATAPWMQNFIVSAMGRAAELGWPTEKLLEYSSRPIRGIFSYDIEPNLLFAYVLPTHDNQTNWFTNWQNVFGNYQASYVTQLIKNVAAGQDTEHGYYSIAMCAASYVKDQENGLPLWRFIQNNIAIKESYHSNPKWALTPR
ncbi:hypothetical protein [Thalassotalea sp. PP2-459]|uniref:InlB B-repeat-containing protein n=1 Tax=Thalassotalea sp. PP2-459 TaxID=1742724 RepID=UPI000941ED61|nr:hypothetical protein [Thalassotalea sp. PP2-459]OKY26725.1 hypothetical protein BI291_01665 [Thalassotalea sp. PP2-459]